MNSPAAGDRILSTDVSGIVNFLTGVSGSGQALTLIYNAAGAIALQPSSDPAAATQLLAVKNNAGTVKFAIRADGSLVFADASVQTTAGVSTAATVSAAGTLAAVDQRRMTVQALGSLTVGTTAINFALGNRITATLAGAITFTFANPTAGSEYQLILTQDATGSRIVTWPTVKWPGGTTPTLTTAINKTDIITLTYDGTSYFGTSTLNF